MPRYVDVEGYRKLFDEKYKKTRELIWEGETHLDNLAEGFSEASRVIDMMPTADVVPRADYENLKIELEAMRGAANSYKMHYEGLAKKIFEEIYEDCFDQFGYIDYEKLAELKNKYTKGDEGK